VGLPVRAGGIIGHLAGHGSAPTEMPNVGADPRVCPAQADLIGLKKDSGF